MMTRPQVDALVSAIKARDLARAQIYCDKPSDAPIPELVPSLNKLHELAQALNMGTYKLKDFVNMEAVDYAGVRFFAVTNEVM